ncbi:pachytene checkpoint protein 2 homolog [Anopheles bellator]|uniref:pachytene checkpoint protein 2 homolog n=1 Tax=Anopheles bellator TaxID=139047 RepID=UPI002649A201|nr:pachytene checkpoint protein 2 homolog [Anopheles bellator]
MGDIGEPIMLEVVCNRGFNKIQQRSDVFTHVHEILEEREEVAMDTVLSIPVKNVVHVLVCTNVDKYTQRSALKFNFYVLHDGAAEEETIDHGGEAVEIAQHWLLPSRELHGLWESLIYEEEIKEGMLSFAETSMLFARKSVSSKLVACNRLALFHGPPGTGKTSLCKAIAQKLSIRLNEHYKHFHLFEINSHSLFSRWFSESGKLVQKVFSQVTELLQDRSSLVCLLMDEIESIAYARDKISSNEPTDSIRVVNAVLTQLDRVRLFPNVFVLATSNLTDSIDGAFLDRADFVQYIGYPSTHGIYEIYRMALEELIAAEIIKDEEQQQKKKLCIPSYTAATNLGRAPCTMLDMLVRVSMLSQGLSGRTLRKIPFLAHALYVKKESDTLLNFLAAMRQAVSKVRSDKELLGKDRTASEKSSNGSHSVVDL